MIDLRYNYPSIDREAEVISYFFKHDNNYFTKFLEHPKLEQENYEIFKTFYNLPPGMFKGQSEIVNCLGGNHAISVVLKLLCSTHQKLITEQYTYSVFKGIAFQQGFELSHCESDNDGLLAENLVETINRTKAKLLYLQPTIHNPTCVVMPLERRLQIAELVKQKNMIIIEDDAYRFLHPDPPLRFLDIIPENTIHIFSLSKPFNSLLKSSFVILPKY